MGVSRRSQLSRSCSDLSQSQNLLSGGLTFNEELLSTARAFTPTLQSRCQRQLSGPLPDPRHSPPTPARHAQALWLKSRARGRSGSSRPCLPPLPAGTSLVASGLLLLQLAKTRSLGAAWSCLHSQNSQHPTPGSEFSLPHQEDPQMVCKKMEGGNNIRSK